jgi:hypothetical protein
VEDEVDYVDGNSLAGPLREIFAVDVSAATAPCAACRQVNTVAELQVYAGPRATRPGARGPGCESVVLRIVRGTSSVWLDLRGASVLRLPMPD